MALDIQTQDIIIDESIGLQDDDINPSGNTNPTLLYLLGLDDPGGLTSPEVAHQADFVQASASAGETISGIVLAKDASGTPFSKTVGVNSGIQTVDGNYVWLFQDATNPNVVIGVIGTSDPAAEPDESGPLAFAFGLDPTSATKADLYLVQYVPLLHPDETNPDDRIDLTDHVYASVTGTSVLSFLGQNAAPGNHDFYVINSSTDASKQLLVTGFVAAANATANVSTQGFGIGNQSINPTETLQCDFVTGGNLPAGSGSQIQYGSHLDSVTQAGFTINQVTPSNPNLRVDITIRAFDNTGNEQGTDFFNGTATSAVDITSIKLTGASGLLATITADGTYATASGNVTITGLTGTGNAVTIAGLDNVTTVDFTTATQMDRLTVSGVDSNEGCDITEFHFTSQSSNAHTEEVGSFINFDDDGPTITADGTPPELTVDETDLTGDDSDDFSTSFTSDAGADGDAISYALGISQATNDSGLVDTATGDAVLLFKEGDNVVGRAGSAAGAVVFTVSVSAAGVVTLDQARAVVHPDDTDPDDSITLAAADLITLTATITDNDGDEDSATHDIGQNLNFKDDGPTITATGTPPELTVDETDLTGDDSDDFSTSFTSDAGADGDAISYALGISQATNDSGLVDTATGDAVLLFKEGDDVVGRAGSAAGAIVFTVSVSAAGVVTLDQARAVVHPDDTDPDDSITLAAADLITLTATITDNDGDEDSATHDIGQNLNFKDDGPTITADGTPPELTVDETDLTGDDSDDFSTSFTSDAGADGDAISYALGISQATNDSGLVDTATGDAVLLFKEGDNVVGRAGSAVGAIVFTVSVSAAGVVTLDQARAVVHPDDTDPDDSITLAAADLITLTATITDNDGDEDSATHDIGQNLNFKDDGPTITATGTPPELTVDETDLTGDDSDDFSTSFTSDAGADGDAISYALGISQATNDSGLVDTATGDAVLLFKEGDDVVGRAGSAAGAIVFTVSVSAAGVVTLDQARAVVHPDDTDPDDSITLAAADLITLTATITDNDGDEDSATHDIGQNLNFKDDGPTITADGTPPELTVDETDLTGDDSDDFSTSFTSDAGADGDAISYALGISQATNDSGLVDTATGDAVLLFKEGDNVVGRAGSAVGAIVFTVSVSAAGVVTLDQARAVVHPDDTDPDDSITLAAADLITLTATITDNDGDEDSATHDIGQNLNFKDDGPTITATGTPPELTVDETDLTGDDSDDFSTSFTSDAGADGDAISYALGISQVTNNSGLTDTLTGDAVLLFKEGDDVVGRAGSAAGAVVFTVSVAADGTVTLDQARAVIHSPDSGPDQETTLASDDLVTLTATITDGDGDQDSDTANIGTSLVFKDDAPTITVPFDGDQTGAPGTHETLANTLNATATGDFGYNIGADARTAAFYTGGGSDFVDTDAVTVGIQINLTGTVDNDQNPAITQAVATLAAETETSATFDFSFHYDKDPITAGVQDATAGGTLVFDKVADTYTFTLSDVIEGFSFDVLHTSELVAKAPSGNTGHPLIVAEQLTQNADPNPFFVQFTANTTTQKIGFGFNSTGDGAPSGPPTDTAFTQGAHDMVTNVNEDWVSATQATNGVAGDTIQKGELLTLRFFQENILGDVNPGAPGGGNERLDPTTKAGGIVIKFDGIGAAEDLIVILDLKDANGNEITRAVNVQNSDLIKGNANVPAPYNTEFTLDNNDALLIIEQNDYTVAGETYQIQGVQIMQSANGLTGNAINLIGATGANGGSNATSNLTAFDPTDNDVLKIVDIGFVQNTSGTISADLDFAFQVADADADQTATQHILVDVS